MPALGYSASASISGPTPSCRGLRWKTLSHSPLLPSQLPLGALNLMDMHRVEKSGPELDSLLINQARHMGVRCPAELVPVILHDGLTSKESGR